MRQAQRALISVSDKEGVAGFARGLVELGVEIISTGGTLAHLQGKGVDAKPVSAVTESPEILGGRVKSLHPRIHGGILADRSNEAHMAELEEQGITPIDIVAVNLYPFEKTVSNEGTTEAEAVEMIDIGGPCMTRAAAKNWDGVVVVVDPGDYDAVLEALQAGNGTVPADLRRELALKAFRHTQAYDAAIVEWLSGSTDDAGLPAEDGDLPSHKTLVIEKLFAPRYGENPHQSAGIYSIVGGPGVFGGFEKLQGKELSWNNMLDADAARKLAALFEEPTVAILKHNNPCGVGSGSDLREAYERALACDPVSAYGSVIAVNRPVDGDLAEAMRKLFVEVMIADSFSEEALEIYGRKKNLRIIRCPYYAMEEGAVELRGIDGGFIAQTPDGLALDSSHWTCPTEKKPDDEQRRALEFVWRVTRYVKSNAIVLANAVQSIGVGAGQMSRVDSCRLAIQKAVLPVEGSVAGSDAFFPFRDGVDVLADAGVTAIVQPGGSVRDDEVVAAADERGIMMILTGRRHFRH